MRRVPERYVTPHPWALVDKRRYGDEETYRIAAAWLGGCASVADWGGGAGYFRRFLPGSVRYLNVDGTLQDGVDVVADLATYDGQSDGLMLRHVIDNTPEPDYVLVNALASYRERMAVVLYTPHSEAVQVVRYQYGWPVWNLNHERLIECFGSALRQTIKTGDETVFLLERRA
jgi:hypothetical protein